MKAHGQFPESPWMMFRKSMDTTLPIESGRCPDCVGSLDLDQSIHGHCSETDSMEYVDIL